MAFKQIERIRDIKPDERNANSGTARGSAMIERSLRTCGAGRSILIDKNGKIIAGNKTVENAALVGLDAVQVVQSDGTKLIAVQRTDLDLDVDPRARELALLDNRSGEVNLDWDHNVLELLSTEGIDLSCLFTDAELSQLIGEVEDAAVSPPEQFNSVDESLKTDYQCPKCSYEWSGEPK